MVVGATPQILQEFEDPAADSAWCSVGRPYIKGETYLRRSYKHTTEFIAACQNSGGKIVALTLERDSHSYPIFF